MSDKQQAKLDKQQAKLDKQQAKLDKQQAKIDKQQAKQDKELAAKDRKESEIRTAALQIRSETVTIRKTSYIESLIHLLKGNFGAGVFAMGLAFKQAGIIFGFFATLALGALCTYNEHLLVDCGVHLKEKLKLEFLPNFPETVELCFLNGPRAFKKKPEAVRTIVRAFIMATQLGFCAIYTLFVASSLKLLVNNHYPEMIPGGTRVYIVVVAPILLLTVLLSNLKILVPLSLVSDILIFFGMTASVYICFRDGVPSIFERTTIASPATWAQFFGTTIFAFEGIALVIPIHNEMKKPQLFRKSYGVLNVGLSIVVIGTALMGVLGYLKFGEKVKGSITLNFEKDILAEIVISCVALAILLTYAIQFHVAIDVSWWDIVGKFGPFKHVKSLELVYRIVLALCTFGAAAAIPYLGIFLSLIGSILSTALALIFPALIDISLRLNEEDPLKAKSKAANRSRFFFDGVTILVGIVGFISGSTVSIMDLIEAVKKAPYGD